jgi:hypothetical protein
VKRNEEATMTAYSNTKKWLTSVKK